MKFAFCLVCQLAKVPQQINGFDCGLFKLQYVEELMARWPSITQKNVDSSDIAGFNRRMFSPGNMEVRVCHLSLWPLPHNLLHSALLRVLQAKRGQLKSAISELVRCYGCGA